MKITNRHLRKLRYIAPVFCSMAVLSTQLQAGPTVQLNGDDMRDGMADSGSLGYVGGNTRVGVSINRNLEGQVDLNQIIMEDDSSATSAEGWFGYKIKDDENSTKGLTGGGVKLNHQWVNDEQDTVHKVFGAYDRDASDRAKATVGYGQETEDLFWSGHVSKSISEDKVYGDVTTRAYDYGVGAQVGTFLDSTLTRIRGGIDYEFGTEFADGEDRPGKATLSAGIEQFFHDSPHSISLDLSGNQVSGGNDAESTDFGARLGYRYEFGGDGVYRSATGTSRRRVEIPGSPGRAGRAGVPGIPATRGTLGRPAIPATRGTPGRAAIPATGGTPGRAAIPATRGTPGRAAIAGRPGRAAIPPRYERRAVNTPGHEFVKTTMKLENETFFKINSSKLTQSAMRNLDKIIGQVRGHGYLGAIRITGNTCGLGDPAYDQRLSENRANSVRDYLVDKGFNPTHLIARGLGKGSPKYDRRDDDFRNRRVDLEYVTERSVKKAANKTQYRSVLVQEGRPAVQAIPGRAAIPARAGHPGRAAIPGRAGHPGRPAIPGRAGHPGRPAIPGRAGHPGRPAIPAIAATPGTPSRFVWKTEVVPSAPVWIQRAIRNTISHNKSVSTYTTRTATKAVDDTFTATSRDTTMDVLANDSSGLTLVSVTQPANGTVSIVNGKVVFVANSGFSGTDTFTYTVEDADGNQITSRVTVDVPNAINTAPMAVDDNANTNEATPVMIDVLLNDSDSDGDALTISNISNPANGTVQLVNTQILFTPNANFTGTDTFTYTITDGNNNQTTATVNVVVADVNQAPNALNDNSTTPEGTPVTVNVIGNDTDPEGDALQVMTLGQASNGMVAIVNNQVVYTPNAGFSGNDSFTYVVNDGNGNSTTATVNIMVTDVKSAPIATDDARTTPENTAVTIPVLGNDTDADGDALTIVSATNPANGSVSITGSNIIYTPVNGFSGQDTFDYTITDNDGNNVTATVTVTVTDVNMAPTAVDDAEMTNENTPITINILGNDSDPDGDALSVISVTNPANGSASIVNGNVIYTPGNGFSGQDMFDYIITDGQGNNVTATVTVTIKDVNMAPAAVDDARTTPENTPVTISVLGNDSDPDGDPLSIVSASMPSNGSISTSGNGFIYTPNNGYSGQDTFDYTITDGQGNNVTATVTVTITDANMAPAAVDDARTTNEDTAVTIPVLGNDSDPDGDTLSIVSATTPANGSVTTSGNNFIYTPNNGYSGQDTFNYTITDGQGNNVTAMVTITINPVNDAPLAIDDARTTDENTPVTISVLGNDSDADGDTLSIVSATIPSNGSASIIGNNIVYTPSNDYSGQDTFDYTITDSQGNNVTATVTVTITDVNMPPAAVNDADMTDENTAVTINVLGNDSDPDGDTISLVSNTNPAYGTVTVSGGNYVYTPTVGFVGTDTFSYTITDGNGNNVTAIVTVTVNAINYPPVASNDSGTTPEDTPITINVINNDGDIDGDTITITNVGSPSSGTATFSGNNVIYSPNAGFVGTDSFTYTINDGNGHPVTATVTVTVTAVNKDPIAVDDSASTPYDTPVTINVASNDSDPDGTTTCVSNILTNPSSGSVSISGNGTDIIYTPNPGFTGTDSFVYTACDANGGTDTATVTVTVGAMANLAPQLTDDNVTTSYNAAITMDVTNNDTDPENDTLTVTGTTPPANGGSVSIVGNNVVYTPSSGYVGVDSYTYTVNDGNGNTATAKATVTIAAAPNQPPVALNNSSTAPINTPVTTNVLNNDSDPDGDTLTITGMSNPSNGSVAISTSNSDKIVYTPNTGFTGTDSYSYTISDGNGNTDTATVTITVSSSGTSVHAVNDTIGTHFETPVTINVAANDTDPEGGNTCVNNIATPPGNGSVSISTNGQDIVYTPNTGFTGIDTFVYTACDSDGDLDTATVTVVVDPSKSSRGTNANANPVIASIPPITANAAGATSINIAGYLSDADGHSVYIAIADSLKGSITFNGTTLQYTPDQGAAGSDNIYLTVSDGKGGTADSVITVYLP